MDSKERLSALRNEIDRLDERLVALFLERMRVSRAVADAKAQGGIALFDATRESQVIASALSRANGEHEAQVEAFMRTLMELSKAVQSEKLMPT